MTAYLSGELNGLAMVLGLAALVATFLLLTLALTAADRHRARRAERALIEPCTDTHEYEHSPYGDNNDH